MEMNANRTMIIGMGLLALLMLAMVPVMAEGEEGSPEEEQGRVTEDTGEGPRLKLRVDRDGDGYISLREFNAFINGRLDEDTVKRIFNAADKDQDGKLSRREFGQAVSMAARAKAKQNSPDKDGDGYISLREFNAFINGRLDEDTVKRVFNAADRDQDGKLSRREFTYALRLGVKAHRSQGTEGSEECPGECTEQGPGAGGDNRQTQRLRERMRERIRERIRERLRERQRPGNGE